MRHPSDGERERSLGSSAAPGAGTRRSGWVRWVEGVPTSLTAAPLAPWGPFERLGLAAPMLIGLVAIALLGVPVLRGDEWDGFADTLLDIYEHGLTWGALWSSHNEHRILLPRLFFLLDSRIDLNPVRLMLVSHGILTLLLLLPLLRQAAATLPGRWRGGFYFLCSACFYSFSQWENIFWGFQIGWTLEVLALGLVVTGLLEGRPVRVALGFAVAYVSSAHFLALVPLLVLFAALRLARTDRPQTGRPSSPGGASRSSPRPSRSASWPMSPTST